MTSSVPRVDISSLSIDKELGRGGQGRVVAINGFMIRGKWPAAAKLYPAGHLGDVDSAVLEQMVGLPRQLTPDSSWLLENTSWPAVMAEDDGTVCGFLMRTVPDDFYFDFRTRTLGSQRKLADAAFLLNSDSYISTAGINVTDWHRLHLLKSLAALLTRLHSIGVVVGDLSPKNLLFSLSPSPRCFLIDCDAAQIRGETVLRQVETPDWEVPAGEAKATVATDAYKFGLLAIRLFARDQSSRDAKALALVSAELGRLANLSQQTDAIARPTPSTWIAALDAAATRAQAGAQRRPAATTAPVITAPTATARQIAVPSPVLGSASRRARPAVLAVGGAVLAVVLIILGVLKFENHAAAGSGLSRDAAVSKTTPEASSGPSGTTPSSSSSSPPSSASSPSVVGVVDISNGAIDDPQAVAVARMFNTYFSGIDDHNYRKSISVFDPIGIINPNDPSSLPTFAAADSTSDDANVVLVNVEPADGAQASSAEVTFQSRQAAGYGPSGAPNQTCTRWDITYHLTMSSSGQYQIYDVTNDVHNSC